MFGCTQLECSAAGQRQRIGLMVFAVKPLFFLFAFATPQIRKAAFQTPIFISPTEKPPTTVQKVSTMAARSVATEVHWLRWWHWWCQRQQQGHWHSRSLRKPWWISSFVMRDRFNRHILDTDTGTVWSNRSAPDFNVALPFGFRHSLFNIIKLSGVYSINLITSTGNLKVWPPSQRWHSSNSHEISPTRGDESPKSWNFGPWKSATQYIWTTFYL